MSSTEPALGRSPTRRARTARPPTAARRAVALWLAKRPTDARAPVGRDVAPASRPGTLRTRDGRRRRSGDPRREGDEEEEHAPWSAPPAAVAWTPCRRARTDLGDEEHLLEVVEIERAEHLDTEQEEHERAGDHGGADHEGSPTVGRERDPGDEQQDRHDGKHPPQQVEDADGRLGTGEARAVEDDELRVHRWDAVGERHPTFHEDGFDRLDERRQVDGDSALTDGHPFGRCLPGEGGHEAGVRLAVRSNPGVLERVQRRRAG